MKCEDVLRWPMGPTDPQRDMRHRDVPVLGVRSNSVAWTLLIIAGLFEIIWAIGLKYTEGFTRLWPSVGTIAAMIIGFILLSQAIRTIPVGTGYAVWTGIGVVGTAVVGMLFLGEPRDAARIICLLLIVVGIVGLKIVSPE